METIRFIIVIAINVMILLMMCVNVIEMGKRLEICYDDVGG